jgi:tRNA pseudouridine55 synthase
MKFTLWKPFGITSNYFIDELKSKNNYNKICYAGRLDPLAQGQMLILTDDDVKTMEINLKHNKTYQFDLILGISTSSFDIAGDIIDEQHITNIDSSYITNALRQTARQATVMPFQPARNPNTRAINAARTT